MAEKEKAKSANKRIRLDAVRVAFPKLYEKEVFQGKPTGYAISAVIEPGSAQDKLLQSAMKEVATAKWGDKGIAQLKHLFVQGDTCLKLHNPELPSEVSGFEKAHRFKAINSDARPVVIDQKRNPIAEEDGIIYAGCFCNLVVDIWAQDNQFGKRINAKLKGVQFLRDGPAFTADVPIDVDSDFEDISEGIDDDAEGSAADNDDLSGFL